jgi:RNA polymerase sigma factor (sigma-70 family)
MNVISQMYGKVVRTVNEDKCVIVDYENEKYRLLKEDGSFIYDKFNIVDDEPLNQDSKLGQTFKRFEKLQNALIESSKETLQKARPGLVQKIVQVKSKNGKTFNRVVWVRPDGDIGGKEKRISKSNKWYDKLKPTEDEFSKIKGKDVNTLVNYIQERFWQGAQVKEKTIVTPSGIKKIAKVKVSGSYTEPGTLAYAFVKSNVDGYEIDDLIQEATIKLMELQDRGSFQNVALEKFPSYVATIFSNVGRNMSRTNKNKSIGDAIDSFVETIQAEEKASEQEVKQLSIVAKQKVDDIYSAVIKEIKSNKVSSFKERGVTIFNQYLAGKKSKEIAKNLGTNDNTIKQVLKRLNVYVNKVADSMGVKTENPAKTFKQAYRQINRPSALAKSFKYISRPDGTYAFVKVPEPRPVTEEIEFNGFIITIENPTGSIRSGEDWFTFMDYPYGYVQNTVGMDGEEVDCFLGSYLNSPHVYVVTIKDPFTGEIDEEKVFFGFNNDDEVMETFYRHYDDDSFFHSIEYMNIDQFKSYYLANNEEFNSLRKSHGLQNRKYVYENLEKSGKGSDIGTISTRRDGSKWKKVSDRKWERVKQETEPKTKNPLSRLPKTSKEAFVSAIKGLANIIADGLSGEKTESVGTEIGHGIDQTTNVIKKK